MRIAVIGTGIAGLTAARELHGSHELTVFEASDWVGGHTHTLDVPTADGSTLAVDTGFIVFNEKTYPGFCGLLQELGVPWQASDMSFSVKCDRTGLEYNGTNLDKLFAQRSNLLRPSFWRMVKDILRFYREAEAVLDPAAQEETLGGYLERNGYGRAFIEQHMIPMGAAIWSTCPEEMLAFPLRFLVQFFHNHGFLQVDGRPQWLVVEGGSRSYVEPLTRPFRDRIRLRTPVHAVSREPDGRVRVRSADGGDEVFDRVVMATHSDTTQKLLVDATPVEREVLGAIRFQPNSVILHTLQWDADTWCEFGIVKSDLNGKIQRLPWDGAAGLTPSRCASASSGRRRAGDGRSPARCRRCCALPARRLRWLRTRPAWSTSPPPMLTCRARQ